MNRALRTTVPTTREQRKPEVLSLNVVKERDALLKTRQKNNFNKHHGTRELPPLNTGQLVWLPESNVTANVGEQVSPRSYSVTTPQGEVRRNRRDLIQLPETTTTSNSLEITTPKLPIHRSMRETNPPKRLISDPNWT